MYTKFIALFAFLAITANAAYFPTVSINNFNALGIYNLTLPVLTDGGMSQLQVDLNGKLLTSDTHNDANWVSLLASVSSIDGKIPLNLTVSATRLLVDGSGVTQPISAASLPLPTGAATETTLQSVDTSSSKISDAVTSNLAVLPPEIMVVGGYDGTAVHPFTTETDGTMDVAVTSSVLPSGAATDVNQATEISSINSVNATLGSPMQNSGGSITANAGTNLNTSALALESGGHLASIDTKLPAALGQQAMAASLAVVISSDQSAIQQKAPLNSTASGSSAGATVSTVASLTAPSNTVGFILMNLDTSTTNMRWAIGRTASVTLGQQLQPGRSTDIIPFNGNVSIIAESGTCNYDIQWISQ